MPEACGEPWDGCGERPNAVINILKSVFRWRSTMTMTMTPGLTGKSVGVMTPQKRICFTDVTGSLARCAGTNCLWTDCIATRPEMDSCTCKTKSKQGPQAVAVLNSPISHRILGFGDKTRRKQEARRRRPGDQVKRKHQEGGRQDTTIQQSYLL